MALPDLTLPALNAPLNFDTSVKQIPLLRKDKFFVVEECKSHAITWRCRHASVYHQTWMIQRQQIELHGLEHDRPDRPELLRIFISNVWCLPIGGIQVDRKLIREKTARQTKRKFHIFIPQSDTGAANQSSNAYLGDRG